MKRIVCVVLIFLLGVPLTVWAQETESATQPTYPSLKIAGFGDFNFSATDESDSNSGFNQGQFVLHFSSVLFVKTSFFAETTITAKETATDSGKESFKVGIERIFISFTHSDYLKVSFGRFHTPVNWWNTAFHHGLWLQTSIQRPEMTKFGGKFIPVHFVGVLLEGKLPAYGLNINYNLGVGNGRDSSVSGAGAFGDVNNDRAWVINLFTRPDRFFGLQAGGALYHDKITLVGGSDFREWITSGYIVWQRENPEVIAEIANVRHHALGSGGASNSLAYYIQVAYRLPWFGQRWKPYYRYESINIPGSDAVFTCCPLSSLSRSDNFKFRRSSIVGMRFDISHFAAIKAEYRNLQRFDLPRVDGGFAQVSLTF